MIDQQENQAQQLTGILSDWLRREELAAELGVSVDTLARWHARREGPPCVKIGRRIFYRSDTVRAWLQSQESQPSKRRKSR